MRCALCKKNEATVHLQTFGTQSQKIDLCEACAKEKGVNNPAGFSFADLKKALAAKRDKQKPE